MKRKNHLYSKRVLIFVSLFIFVFAASDVSFAQPKSKRKSSVKREAVLPKPSNAEGEQMAKKALLDFNDAVKTEDFTEFYSKISRVWQKQIKPKDLQKAFQEFIDKRVDIGEIAEMDVVFTKKPIIKKSSGYFVYILTGYYPTSPNTTKFTLKFMTDQKQWKLWGIEVSNLAD